MTGAEIKARLAFANEVYSGLVRARLNAEKEEIKGLEKAIAVLTDVVMEMGRNNEKGR